MNTNAARIANAGAIVAIPCMRTPGSPTAPSCKSVLTPPDPGSDGRIPVSNVPSFPQPGPQLSTSLVAGRPRDDSHHRTRLHLNAHPSFARSSDVSVRGECIRLVRRGPRRALIQHPERRLLRPKTNHDELPAGVGEVGDHDGVMSIGARC